MLKKAKQGDKLYEMQIVKFVIRLKSFKKSMSQSWLGREGRPLYIQNNSEHLYCKGFYTLCLIYMVKE